MRRPRSPIRFIRAALRRLAGTFTGSRRDRDLAEELESHLQLHIDDNVRSGMRPADARRAALVRLGPIEAIKEEYRDRRGVPVLAHVGQDLRFAARLLRKAPGFSVTAIVTIALAVGVNAAIFTILNAAALQPLAVPDGGRLATVAIGFEGEGRRGVHGSASMLSYAEYLAVRSQTRAFDGVLAFSPFNPATIGGPQPRSVLATLASCNYFEVLRIHAALGRVLAEGDCAPGAPATAVLSDRIWRSAFAADPSIVDRTVMLNRAPFRVVGVAEAGFTGTQLVPEDAYVPVTLQSTIARDREALANPNMSWLVVMGRLRDGASLASLRPELAVIAARITATLPPGRTARLTAGRSTLSTMPEIRTVVLAIGSVILAAVALVLLMACANIANLLLARASARRREMAVRLALGAGRGRLVQQLLTESLVLAAAGGVAGFIAASWTSRAVVRFLLGHLPPGAWPMVFDPQPDWRVALYSVALTALTGVAFGLVPALQATRRDLGFNFREGSGTDRRSSRRLQSTLVTVQVAVCLVLLLSAALLARGLYRAQTIDPGINMHNVTVVAYDLPNAGYKTAAAATLQRQVLERVAALPDVRTVAQTSAMPLSDQHAETEFVFPGSGRRSHFEFSSVSPSYFDVLHLPLVRGRAFNAAEVMSEAASIVTESTARRLWPGVDPLGQVLRLDDVDRPVVGVIRDAQVSRLGRTDEPYVFLPAGPDSQMRVQMLVAGATAAPAGGPIRAAVAAIDPQLAVEITNLEDNLEQWRAPSKLVASLAATLAALALVLACTGVFGTVAYAVSRRVREIGIRVALGAAHGDVLGMIVRQGMRPVAIGIAIGLPAAAAVSTVLATMLFGLSPHDPWTFALAPAALFAIALAACYAPARRALRVEPSRALHTD
ncbi:MAG: ABC transporter permease [Vicinamibacterales bacterium]